jgi:hypothetical protein
MKSHATRKSQLLEGLENRRLMAAFSVTNVNDSGAGSLRAAILSANATPAADTITFALSTASSKVIQPLTELPIITAPLTVDGTSQSGYTDRPIVEIRGSNIITPVRGGLTIGAPNTTIAGLAITDFKGNFASGVQVNTGATGAIIRDNHLGVVAYGYGSLGNGMYGIHAMEDGVQILRNVIADNDDAGIFLDHVDNAVVRQNIIGATRDGVVELGSQPYGIYAQTADNVVVGSEDNSSLGNVIMGDQSSIRVQNGTAWSIAGNTLGMNAARTVMYGATSAQISTVASENWTIGTADAPNFIAGTGMFLQDCTGMGAYYNVIGTDISQTKDFGGEFGIWGFNTDASTFVGNIIGNHVTGLALTGNSDSNQITSNFIGVSSDPNRWLGNSFGVNIAGSNNRIGTASSGNVIAHNHNKGVVIASGTGNVILSRVFSNAMINIDLNDDGATANDGMTDTDTGANNLLNAPYVQSATALANGNTSIHVGLQTIPGSYRVDIYSSMWPDSAGKGSGETLLTTLTVNVANPNGWSQTMELPQHIPAGFHISAVATKLSNGTPVETSEFSYAEEVFGNPEVIGSSFKFEYYHRFEFQFSKNVWNSIQSSDFVFTNLNTGQTFTPDGGYIDPTNRIYSPSFSTPLPDGNYTAFIDKDNVYDILGRTLVSDYTMEFFVLSGDVNRDRAVNFDDLLLLAQNYGTNQKSWSTGDMNYDQKVDFSDLLILAQKYGSTLPEFAGATAPQSGVRRDRMLDVIA